MQNALKPPLRPDHFDLDPIQQFQHWLRDAEQTDIAQPNAMTVATSNQQGKPAARIVLLRGVDDRGFVFFTNYESRKGQDLSENPHATLMFYWPVLSRQVRIEGRVEKVEPGESDQYFANRPRGHQIEAHASAQSQVIKDRLFLDQKFKQISHKFAGQKVPRPLHWGGYRVIPELVEFWQEGENRLHDRLRYHRNNLENWEIERLSP